MGKNLSDMSLEELWQLFPIILTKHDSNWNKWYDDEAERLGDILKEIDVARISHIGSTAIKGIWAKPIVDILVEIERKDDLDVVSNLLEKQGYLCMSKSNTRMDMNKGYTKEGFAERVFHIHIRLVGDHEELYFRDYLNDNPEIAKNYEALKLSLWKQYEHNRDAYTEAKTDFVKEYTRKGRKEYGDKYRKCL